MTAPALVAVAHGSRDPRSAATVRELVAAVAVAAPRTVVRASFLDLSYPRFTEVLTELHGAGHREVVAVPLLLGHAYHARVDLPALTGEATERLPGLRVRTAEVLGTDPALDEVALHRLAEAGVSHSTPELGLVLGAVGSADQAANDAVAEVATRWQRLLGLPVAPAFATTDPGLDRALTGLRAAGARRFALAPWFLAPGLLLDRLAARAAEHGLPVAAPLGADPRVAGLVLRRYHDRLSCADAPGTTATELV